MHNNLHAATTDKMNTDNFTGLHSNSLKVRSVFSVFLAGDWLYLFFISAKNKRDLFSILHSMAYNPAQSMMILNL